METYTYDLAARPTKAVTPAGTTTYAWDADGHLVSSVLPNATTETQTWDRAGQLAKVATAKGTTALVSQTVTRDAADNPTQIVVARGAATDTRSFLYDPNERLRGVCYLALASCTGSAAATQWWTYDLDGNRKTEKNGTATATTTTYTYDTANQLTSRQTGTAAAVASTYDADGNNLTDGTVTWTYDLNNRVTSSKIGTVVTAWQRDGEGNVLKQTAGTAITSYGWDLLGTVPKLSSTSGTVAGTYRHDPLGRLSTLTTGTTHQTAAHDTLGAPTDLLTSTGVIARATDWTPFGTARTAIGAPTGTGAVSRIGYAGMASSSVNGTSLTRDRIYNPSTARWTATDPLAQAMGAASDSPYTYVTNQPGVFVDPFGAAGCLWWALQCGGAWHDIGQGALGVGDTARQMASAASQPLPLTLIHTATGLRDAYRAEGLGYAINQLNPAYHLLEDYTAMWVAGNDGCVRNASAAGARGAVDAASITGLAAFGPGVLAKAGRVGAATNGSGRTVAIGRNMTERVIPYAQKNGYDWYTGTPRWVPRSSIGKISNRTLDRTDLWFNKRWINKEVRNSSRIVDIGEPPGYAPSPSITWSASRSAATGTTVWTFSHDSNPSPFAHAHPPSPSL